MHAAIRAPRASTPSHCTTMQTAHTLSVSIALPSAAVYAFVADPENLPRWARLRAVLAG